MENKPAFNKNIFATIALQKFITDYSRGQNIDNIYINLLAQVNKNDIERIKIIDNIKALFENPSTLKEVNLEIETIRNEFNATKGRNPTDSEIAKWLIKCFSEEIYDISKRTYDMSKIASNGMLSTFKTSQGKVLKKVKYISFEEMAKNRTKKGDAVTPQKIGLVDKHGNPISVEFVGCLAYETFLSREYIFKLHIVQTIDGVVSEHDVFSNIDIKEMKTNKDYRDAVVSELLSKKNITLSNADGYIGEIHEEPASALKPGEEKCEYGIYTYRISKRYTLIYNGERIEAIKAHREQPPIKRPNEKEER